MSRTVLRPEALRPGDRIGICAPASAPNDPTRLDVGFEAMKKLGFEPVLATNARKKLGFLGGTDQERADDLHELFADPSIKAIVCERGGYGTTRILRLLDRELIRANPKIFVGYSDTTALSAFFFDQCGLVSFYGPMVAVEFYKGASPFILDSFLKMLTGSKPYGPLGAPEGWPKSDTLVGGVAKGRLAGGCLTLFEATLGTPWQTSFRDSIFFWEEIDSEPYQLDRTLTHMLEAGVMDGVLGIAVGECVGCEHEVGRSGYDNCQSFRDVVLERFGGLGVPIVTGLPFGHGNEKATIPYGVEATLDGNTGELIITEAAVVESYMA